MSVFYGVRLTDEISAMIEATGRGKSAVIQAALDAYFEGKHAQVEKPQAKQMIIAKPAKAKKTAKQKQPCDHHAIGDDEPIAREVESARDAEIERPAVSGGCRKHPGGGGWAKAGGWWCLECGKIV